MFIYKITNKINGKCYIGQTTQKPSQRWREHGRKSNKRYISIINKAILKYGKDNFDFEVVCACDSVEDLNDKEVELIKETKSLVPKGYNIRNGGNHSPCSESTRIKISKANSKAVVRVDKVTLEEKNYPSAAAAGRDGFDENAIRACCRGKMNHHRNYYWKYPNDKLVIKKTYNASRRIPIIRIDDSGNVQEYESFTQASLEGFAKCAIKKCCDGIWNHYKNYIWKYKEV